MRTQLLIASWSSSMFGLFVYISFFLLTISYVYIMYCLLLRFVSVIVMFLVFRGMAEKLEGGNVEVRRSGKINETIVV